MTENSPSEGTFHLMGGEFTNAGSASSELKSTLIKVGVEKSIVRRVAIAAFEAEMNVIIHAVAGTLRYEITTEAVTITVTDMGPGIENINQAMQPGYSTAPDWVREMGWGAGMGLPNISKHSDLFKIDSVVGEGTTLEIIFDLKEKNADS
ncbi:MAG: ATP-binding protein [Nitrospirae bacterium]|nr:ATP-binding protein [Nitrospirota bacterium]